MKGKRCISCGYIIQKSAVEDPYLCRECELLMLEPEQRFAYLDR